MSSEAARSLQWAEHVREGGTTPWVDLDPVPDGAPYSSPLPSAAHLELARRVGVPSLAAALLATPPVGRGRADVPLPGTGAPDAGPPAVDPGELPTGELMRVAVGYLAARLLAERVDPRPPRRPRRGQQRYVVRGRSLSATVVRESLSAAGLVEGGSRWRRPTTVLVVGDALDAMLQASWTARVRAGGGLRWHRACSLAARGSLPADLELADVAAQALAHAGPRDRVELVLLPADEAVAAAAGILGEPVAPVHLPARYDPARVDLLRRVDQALASRATRERRAGAAGALDRRLDDDVLAARLAVPREHEGRLTRAAEDLAARLGVLAAGRHPALGVHGDVRVVVPSGAGRARSVPAATTLQRAVEAIRHDDPAEGGS